MKDGTRPTLWRADGAEGAEPVAAVAAMDTTGAGDAFAGACLASRMTGSEPAAAMRTAQAVAAAVVAVPRALARAAALRAARDAARAV